MSTPQSNPGVIVTLLPDSQYAATRPMTADPHLTVLFMGRLNSDDDRLNMKAIKRYWQGLVKAWDRKLPATVEAEAMFDTPDGWAHVDLIDAPALPRFRALSEELLQVYDLPISEQHGLLPHITKRYSPVVRDHIELVQRRGKLKFDLNRMAVWAGDNRFEIELR